jgi:invasion protein IalB
MSHFPVTSGKSTGFAARRGLTGGLPDVGTDEVLHRNLIRDLQSGYAGADRLQGAVITVSVPYRADIAKDIFKEILEGSTLMGPSKHQARSAASRTLAAPGLAIMLLLGLTAAASAQGAVRSVHGDWQIRCDTPPGAQGEQCALIQSVVAEDRSNAGLTVIVLKTADQKSKLMRVVAPLGVLLPSGLGLKLDNVDVGRAGFVRCLPNGCVAEVVMDDKLLGQLRTAKTATFIIFETPEEGIGFPLSLNGIGEGYDKLP